MGKTETRRLSILPEAMSQVNFRARNSHRHCVSSALAQSSVTVSVLLLSSVRGNIKKISHCYECHRRELSSLGGDHWAILPWLPRPHIYNLFVNFQCHLYLTSTFLLTLSSSSPKLKFTQYKTLPN